MCDEVSASVRLCEHAFKCHMKVRSEAKQHGDKTHTWFKHQLEASSSQLTQKLVREEVKILS